MGRPELSDVLERMRKYCVLQDRCHSEVRTKLIKMQVYGDDLEQVMYQLIEEDFLNEERFARSYVRGKFRMNKWGRFKIRMHLRQKQVSDYCIQKGFEEIGQEEYEQMIDDLLIRKLGTENSFKARQKAKESMIRKGYEPDIVGSRLSRIQQDL